MLSFRVKTSLYKRPLCFSLVGFLVLYFILGFLRGHFKAVLATAFLIASLLIIFFKIFSCKTKKNSKISAYMQKARILPSVLLIFSLALSSFMSYMNFDIRLSEIKTKYDGQNIDAKICIIGENRMSEYYSSHDILIIEANGEKCNIKAELISSYYSTFRTGDTVSLPLSLTYTVDYENLSEAYDLSHGFVLEALSDSEENAKILENKTLLPYKFVAKIQGAISLTLEKYMSKESAAFSRALIYDDRSGLDYTFTSSFKELGISHMLAISGMHFSIIVGILAYFLKKLRTPKAVSMTLLSFFILFYALIAGFSPAICRGAFMLLIAYSSFIWGRRSDSVTTLIVAVFVICILNRYAVYDVGLILSFLSTLGILTVALPIQENMKEKSKENKRIFENKAVFALFAALNITLAATLFTLPVSYFCFGYISALTLPANLLFSPIITLIMYLMPILLALSGIKMFGSVLGDILSFLCESTINLSEKIALSGDYNIDLRYFFCTALLVIFFVSIALMIIFIKDFGKKRALLYIPMCIFMLFSYGGNLAVNSIYYSGNSVIYYTEGKNDAIILISDGEALLIDSSDGSYSFMLSALKYAKEKANVTVSAYMISDYHYTHIGSINRLCERGEINSFILPIPEERDYNNHMSVTRFLKREGFNVTLYNRGENSVVYGDFLINCFVFEKKTANPATVIFAEENPSENGEKGFESYMYISNTDGVYGVISDMSTFIDKCVKKSDNVIFASHGTLGDAENKLEDTAQRPVFRDSFYQKLK